MGQKGRPGGGDHLNEAGRRWERDGRSGGGCWSRVGMSLVVGRL